jgi:hypothetical protein
MVDYAESTESQAESLMLRNGSDIQLGQLPIEQHNNGQYLHQGTCNINTSTRSIRSRTTSDSSQHIGTCCLRNKIGNDYYESQDQGTSLIALAKSILGLIFSRQPFSDRTIDTVLLDEYPRLISEQISAVPAGSRPPSPTESTSSAGATSETEGNSDLESNHSSDSNATIPEDVCAAIYKMPLPELFNMGLQRVEQLEADLGYFKAKVARLEEENLALRSHALDRENEVDSLRIQNEELRRAGGGKSKMRRRGSRGGWGGRQTRVAVDSWEEE